MITTETDLRDKVVAAATQLPAVFVYTCAKHDPSKVVYEHEIL
jgi:hypothetical protein